jgi:hypothetical protein
LPSALHERFHGARSRATVATDAVAVVARFASENQTVAADWLGAGRGDYPAVLLLAGRGATISIGGVAIIALLVRGTVSVTTDESDARRSCRAEIPIFLLASRGATVAVFGGHLGVVALFSAFAHAIAAHRKRHAGLVRSRAVESGGYRLAIGRATVAIRRVSVIACLSTFKHAIAADDELYTMPGSAGVFWVLGETIRLTPITIYEISVIANLAEFDDSIAALRWWRTAIWCGSVGNIDDYRISRSGVSGLSGGVGAATAANTARLLQIGEVGLTATTDQQKENVRTAPGSEPKYAQQHPITMSELGSRVDWKNSAFVEFVVTVGVSRAH